MQLPCSSHAAQSSASTNEYRDNVQTDPIHAAHHHILGVKIQLLIVPSEANTQRVAANSVVALHCMDDKQQTTQGL